MPESELTDAFLLDIPKTVRPRAATASCCALPGVACSPSPPPPLARISTCTWMDPCDCLPSLNLRNKREWSCLLTQRKDFVRYIVATPRCYGPLLIMPMP